MLRSLMAKPKKAQVKPVEIETLPDAWERFEKAVDVVAKAKPKPKPHTKTKQKAVIKA